VSVASGIIATLAPTALPCYQNNYTGTATVYLTFNFTTRPENYGDDSPGNEVYDIMVHRVAPATYNATTLDKQIKGLLAAAGYDYPTTIEASDDPAESHLVFETGIAVIVGG